VIHKNKKINTKGFSLVEVILSTSVFSLLVTILVGAYLYGQESTVLAGNRVRAILLAEEGLEVVKNIKDEDWNNLSDGSYGLEQSGSQWELNGTSDTTDIFTREIIISTTGNNRKNISSNVTWQQNIQREGRVSLNTILSYWNEVIEDLISFGDWSSANEIASINLSSSQNAIKIDSNSNHAFLVRQNGSSNLQAINISDSQQPINADSISISGTLTNIVVSEEYAFITSTNNSEELIIVDISDPNSLQKIGSYNMPGNQNARGLFLKENLVYVVRDDGSKDEFYVFDVSTPNSPLLIGSSNLNDDANETVIIGDYAYCATDGDELEVIDVTNPFGPKVVSSLDLKGNSNALTIDGDGNVIYIGRNSGQIHTIDISDPLKPSEKGVIDNGSNIRDLSYAAGAKHLFAASDENKAELQIIDVNNASKPSLVGSYNANSDFNGVSYIEEKDIAVIAAEDNNKEFIIIQSQP